jgi:hypothetical protein
MPTFFRNVSPPSSDSESKKVELFLCLVNEALRHEGVWGMNL